MDQDFNEWYNKSLKQCNEAYNSVSSYCHNYVYNKLSNPPRTDELNDLIDNAFKYRLGLIDEKPRANDKSINEFIDNHIFLFQYKDKWYLQRVHNAPEHVQCYSLDGNHVFDINPSSCSIYGLILPNIVL